MDKSQCPCCGRGECGPFRRRCRGARPDAERQAVSMPLLRAGGVRACPYRAGLPSELVPVSMPLLRAGGVRDLVLTGTEGGRVPVAVSMPLLRAGGVRGRAQAARRLSQCPCCGRGECVVDRGPLNCLNALVAGGGSAGGGAPRIARSSTCLNALVAGGGSAGLVARHDRALVSMPLLRAGEGGRADRAHRAESSGLSQCPCCGRGECRVVARRGLKRPPLSQCPCCGRGECGRRGGPF